MRTTTTSATAPTGSSRRSGRGHLVLALVGLALGAPSLVACAGSTDDASTAARRSERSSGADGGAVAKGVVAGGAAPADAAKDAPALPPIRLRAVTGTLVVRTAADADLEAAVRSATATVVGLGGYLFAEDSSFGRDGAATVTYKVPPDRYGDAVAGLSELGTPVASSVDTTDVTDQVVDLDSRIRSAEASVARVRTLLEDATTLGDVTMLEGELTRRETTLEQLTGQRRQTVGTAEMSTLTLTLDRKAAPVAVAEGESWMASVPGFGSALAAGWRVFGNLVRVVLAVVGWIAPFVGLALVALLAFRVVRRRHPVAAAVGRDGEI